MMMNKRLFNLTLLASVICWQQIICNTALLDATKSFFTADKEERKEQLAHLEDDLTKFKANTAEQLKLISQKREQNDRLITDLNEQIKTLPAAQQEFPSKKKGVLNEINQVLFNIQFTAKEIVSGSEQHIKILKDYKKDPLFKDLELEPRSFYSFEIVQNANKKVVLQEDVIAQITAQKNDALIELENRKKKQTSAAKEAQDRKREQEEYGTKAPKESTSDKLSFSQQGELLDLNQRLANYEKQLADLKVQEINRRIGLINTRLFIESEKLKIFKNNLDKAKMSLRVSQTDVITAQEALEKRKQESIAAKDKFYDEIKTLSVQRDKLKNELEQLSKRYRIPITPHLTSWSVETPTLETYTAVAQMGYKNAQTTLLDRRIEYLRAEIDLTEATVLKDEINTKIINSWFKVTQRRFKQREDVGREVKPFKDFESEISHELTLLQDKRAAATNLLGVLNKELSEIRQFNQSMQQEKEGIFKRYPTRFNQLTSDVAQAEKTITEHIDYATKLVEVYTNTISQLSSALKEISFILHELETKSIWQRSEYAITWNGIKNIGTDLSIFITDLKNLGTTYFTYWRWQTVFASLIKLLKNPAWLLLLILAILSLIGFVIVLRRRLLPDLYHYFNTTQVYTRAWRITYALAAATVLFVKKHLIGIIIWALLFIAIYFDFIADLFPTIIFYLLSIPYLLYLATEFIRHIILFNRSRNFVIFQESFERRFFIVASLFSYTTIILLFLREAFILATLHKSELPTILLASYSIFLRTLVIFSIGKDEIVSILTNKGPFWSWLAEQIDRYYYLLLISIVILMIISDPYVGGYGNLVSYILWGLIGTFVLVKLILLAHQYAKKWSTYLFFITDEEVMRERFVHAKTAYGLFVIGLFILLIGMGIYVGSKLWQIPFTIKDVFQILNFQIFETGIDKLTNQPIWFTPLKLLVILLFIITGFVTALLFDRFALGLVFEVLPVDPGVQNTISSLTRYLILIIAIYLGFQWGGLGTLLIAIGVVLGSISWIVKEPIADFISYFIILVQRPVQIGDYIMLDEENQGVVRKITARSTILRRKDSYTIILPNSMLLNKPISNWNYARNFVAFDDIEFAVPFGIDPALVKKLIMQVLDENPDVLKSPKPVIRLHDFGENGYIFKVRGFITDVNIVRKWDIASDVRFALVQKLREHNIKIAVPTRVIISGEYK